MKNSSGTSSVAPGGGAFYFSIFCKIFLHFDWCINILYYPQSALYPRSASAVCVLHLPVLKDPSPSVIAFSSNVSFFTKINRRTPSRSQSTCSPSRVTPS